MTDARLEELNPAIYQEAVKAASRNVAAKTNRVCTGIGSATWLNQRSPWTESRFTGMVKL